MKNLICVYSLIALFQLSSSTKAQSPYVVTNYSSMWYYVQVSIASDPIECNFWTGIPTRDTSFILSPYSCSVPQRTITLQLNEWVYKIAILEMNACTSSCTTNYGYPFSGVLLEVCPTSPDTDSWNQCTSDWAEADRTSYCDIND